jgi:hypothetical protein
MLLPLPHFTIHVSFCFFSAVAIKIWVSGDMKAYSLVDVTDVSEEETELIFRIP